MTVLDEMTIATNIEKLIKNENIFGGERMVKYLSSGNEELNNMLHGGYKKGTLTEICGVSDSGKTLLALKAIKEAEKEDKFSLYISPKSVLNSSMLKDNNINQDYVSILYMNEADIISQILTQVIKPYINNIGVIVIDSLADLSTTKEKNSPLKTNTELSRSKIIKALLSRLSNIVRNTDTCVLIINQERNSFIDNKIVGTVSSSERLIDIFCDTRIKLSKDENNDVYVEVKFKERRL